MALGGITIDVDGINLNCLRFVVFEAKDFARKGDRVVLESRDRIEKTFIMGGVHVAMSAKKPPTGSRGRGLDGIGADRESLGL